MNAKGWRRWELPVYVVLLGFWILALVIDLVAFGGPTSVLGWVSLVVVTLMLVVLIGAELKVRAGTR